MLESIKLRNLQNHPQYRQMHEELLKYLLGKEKQRIPVTEIEDYFTNNPELNATWNFECEQEISGLGGEEQAKFEDKDYARKMKLAWLIGPLNQFGIIKTTNPEMNRVRQFFANLTAKQRTRYIEKHPLWTHNIQLSVNPEAMRKAMEEESNGGIKAPE